MLADSASTGSCIPFRIGEGPSTRGPRLGGPAPKGVAPVNKNLRYFLTAPVGDTGTYFSVFSNTASEFIFGEAAGQVVANGDVEVLFHSDVERDDASRPWDSELTPHPLLLGDEKPDAQDEDGEVTPSSEHKLGGTPYLVCRGGALESQVSDLLSIGFRQLLQIDFPGADDALVSGDWPCGTGMFHVLIRSTESGYEWRCFWED
jgi:hypothetical protein